MTDTNNNITSGVVGGIATVYGIQKAISRFTVGTPKAAQKTTNFLAITELRLVERNYHTTIADRKRNLRLATVACFTRNKATLNINLFNANNRYKLIQEFISKNPEHFHTWKTSPKFLIGTALTAIGTGLLAYAFGDKK